MHRHILFVAAALPLAATTGCQSLTGWGEGLQRQYQQAAEGIKQDLSVLESDHDGLDAFGPDVAKEMRAARADMMR